MESGDGQRRLRALSVVSLDQEARRGVRLNTETFATYKPTFSASPVTNASFRA